MQIGNRFRCYPTPAQEKVLLQWVGCQRFIYNAKVQEDRYFRTFARKSLDHTGQFAPIDQQYSQFKHFGRWCSKEESQAGKAQKTKGGGGILQTGGCKPAYARRDTGQSSSW